MSDYGYSCQSEHAEHIRLLDNQSEQKRGDESHAVAPWGNRRVKMRGPEEMVECACGQTLLSKSLSQKSREPEKTKEDYIWRPFQAPKLSVSVFPDGCVDYIHIRRRLKMGGEER